MVNLASDKFLKTLVKMSLSVEILFSVFKELNDLSGSLLIRNWRAFL